MTDHTTVTVAVVTGLPAPCAWWPDDHHLALRATCVHDLPAALEAAAATIRATTTRS